MTEPDNLPFVSAVIPTRNRAALVSRAVETALNQTYRNLEVIVIVDGPDEATVSALSLISDSRLRVISLPSSVGGGKSRNIGVEAARGEWIAFLDDDDEWASEKITRQLELAQSLRAKHAIIACRVKAQTSREPYMWPKRLPEEKETISDYLFVRRAGGTGLCITTTLFVSRELLLRTPFDDTLRRHQEWDWLLRATKYPETVLAFVPDSLATWYLDDNRPRISNSNATDWKYSEQWIIERRNMVTSRAYAAFLLTYVWPLAIRSDSFLKTLGVVVEAFRGGRPSLSDFIFVCFNFVLPQHFRRRIRAKMPVSFKAGFRQVLPSR